MYEVDEKDRVVPLKDVPQSSVGAPLPVVLADEHRVVLAYYMKSEELWRRAGDVHGIDQFTSEEPIALVLFDRRTHMFGPPNDEAFAGHPLASRGLEPYGSFRIENSSWIRKLERMNSVHPNHCPDPYWQLQHLIFSFHDSTFECVCRSFQVRTVRGLMADMIPQMVQMLEVKS